MKTPTHHSIGVSLEMAVIAFFILAALSLLVVYLADPAIYAQSLSLASSPADRYPVPVTLFLVGILAVIALLILGVVRHWRWVFWLMLVAFSASALQFPAELLQISGVLPMTSPLWYSLFRLVVAVLELGLAVWMIQVYRHKGIWAMGRKRSAGDF
jgi:hypothetical protein